MNTGIFLYDWMVCTRNLSLPCVKTFEHLRLGQESEILNARAHLTSPFLRRVGGGGGGGLCLKDRF